MASKPRFFDIDLFYHIFNCGVGKRRIFASARDYQRFFDVCLFYLYDQRLSFSEFQRLVPKSREAYLQANPRNLQTLRVRILSHCQMPNHFHFLIKQARENGISIFLSDIQNSYTKYFNIKSQRIGNLLQGPFKFKEITDEGSVLQVSRYIHLNPIMSSKANPNGSLKKPEDYPYGSYREWLNPNKSGLVDKEQLLEWLEIAGGIKKYKEFVESMISRVPGVGIEDLIIE